MKKINIIIVCFMALIAFNSCEDYLERQPLDKVSSAAVFEDVGYIQATLMDIYSFMPNGFGWESTGHKARGYGRRSFLDCTTDLIANKSGYVEGWKYVNQGQSPTNGQQFSNYSENYQVIFRCNTLLEGVATSSLKNDEYVKLMLAEVRFLRAFYYFDLVRRYGRVPFITEVSNTDDIESTYEPREDTDVIYDFIYSEFNEVAPLIPLAKDLKTVGSDVGRISREAIWGFNGRAMLHAKRYAQSAAESKKVLDAVADGTSDRKLAEDYEKLFISKGGNEEVLFEIIFNGNEKGGTVDNFSRPPSDRGSWGGQHNPTEDLVRAYEMADGSEATVINGYDPNNPYTNRDPRLSQTVLHHGSMFYGKTMDFAWVLEGDTWTSKPKDDDLKAQVNGNAAHAQGLATITGYYLRKFMDESAPVGDFGMSEQSWIVLRLAEVMLNYAEAQNEVAGPDASVYQAINDVRERSSMPAVEVNYPGLDKEGMFERIKHERKVELCFEGQRFWDIRRWEIGMEICNGTIPEDAADPSKGGRMMCCYPLRQADGSVLYCTPETIDDVLKPGEKIWKDPVTSRNPYIWQDRNYLMPIPQNAIDKNPSLEGDQNPGYGG
ncbi:RagB/SusD family nutrient uptake outer membrane protein [Labilibacter marinus]|uniref:RagB/SusD family nutrient uptake outer membrane protein n=1 Tax=Labilibacter marinus TaxID=1477105 RepID=UPI0013012A30|nr:RagB/SusD family nutrient uptake outer membrane protein [Labilibacter marinus]